jgi:hypothetical protein
MARSRGRMSRGKGCEIEGLGGKRTDFFSSRVSSSGWSPHGIGYAREVVDSGERPSWAPWGFGLTSHETAGNQKRRVSRRHPSRFTYGAKGTSPSHYDGGLGKTTRGSTSSCEESAHRLRAVGVEWRPAPSLAV